jgi:cytochrome d ubiquinol oxidase subunit I
MRTVDAASAQTTAQMTISLVLFVLVYFALFGTGIAYMLKLVHKGPQPHDAEHPIEGGAGQMRTPARPLSASDGR